MYEGLKFCGLATSRVFYKFFWVPTGVVV